MLLRNKSIRHAYIHNTSDIQYIFVKKRNQRKKRITQYDFILTFVSILFKTKKLLCHFYKKKKNIHLTFI